MRGLLATAYAAGSALFIRLARRALRKSERHSARAEWCSKRATELDPIGIDRRQGGAPSTDRSTEKPHE